LWKRTQVGVWQLVERSIELLRGQSDEVLDCYTPYRLVSWDERQRTWVNQYTNGEVIELLDTHLAQPKVIAATKGPGKFEIQATLRRKKITAMLDCEASGNFISSCVIARVNAPIKEIKLYELRVVDRTKVTYNDRIIT
jgi:hypothetical protein